MPPDASSGFVPLAGARDLRRTSVDADLAERGDRELAIEPIVVDQQYPHGLHGAP
jgi:hypothetical protein